MNEQPRAAMTVVSADGVTVGTQEAATDSHIGVRCPETDAPGGQLWLPRTMIARVEDATIRLNRNRAELHEAVYALPPGQQRAFETLGLNVKIGRARGMELGQQGG